MPCQLCHFRFTKDPCRVVVNELSIDEDLGCQSPTAISVNMLPLESANGLRSKRCTCAPQSSQSFSSSCPVKMWRLRPPELKIHPTLVCNPKS